MSGLRTLKDRKNKRTLLLALALLPLAIGCGSSNSGLITGADVNTPVIDGDVYLEVTADINSGKLQLPLLDIPITKNGQEVGYVALQWNGGSKTVLSVAMNVNKIAKLDSCNNPVLPNGSLIPVTGTDGAAMFCEKVSGSVTAYAGLGDGVALLGAALEIKEFQKLGQYVPGFNIFLPFNFGGGVSGVGGLFTGSGSDENGIAVFVDASEALEGLQLNSKQLAGLSSSVVASTQSTLRSIRIGKHGSSQKFGYQKQGYDRKSRRSKRKNDRQLYKLNKRRTKLHLAS